MKSFFLKRFFDFLLSTIIFLFTFPFFILISFLILTFDGPPIFYVQKRVGLMGKQFNIYKFRTMKNKKEKNRKFYSFTLHKDKRVTKIGHFLRNFKFDELPQLINVLKGDMSFVGPRPELKFFTDLYDKKQKEIFLIRPGVTGISSLLFRNESNFLKEEKNPEFIYRDCILPLKLELGLIYKKHSNIITDLNIILITIFLIFIKKNLLISDFLIKKSFRKDISKIEKKISKLSI
ncbi:MAG: sugar transferase [Prochlorococcus marinus CUG1435]|nr:sugar transferase [Prochlorococcus marinus CUG1435]